SIRNTSASANYHVLIILFFYQVPMNKIETFEYAVKQPHIKFRHGSRRTAEEGGHYG
ncbi:unnamed protein product, partial [marine sediment metagenome]